MTDDVLAGLGAQRKARGHRHQWNGWDPNAGALSCSCGAVQDTQKSRRGKSSARLGKDQERRIERVYGPTKVGEFGDAIDLLGHDWKWQSKATRGEMPLWVRHLKAWREMSDSAWIADPIEHMEPLRRDLFPLLIKTWIRQGVQPTDVIIVRSSDWAAVHGPPAPNTEFMAMTGAYFLDINGRDEEKR